jgi:hypothetical protein
LGAEAVKDVGELTEAILKLLLPLIQWMNAVTGRQSLELTRQSTYIVLKALLHVVYSAHNEIMDSILNMSAKINKLWMDPIQLGVNIGEFIV